MNTIFTGLSDFHKLVLSSFKTTFKNLKNFSKENFNHELKTNLGERCVKNYASSENVFLDILNKHAPFKKKLIRANDVPYVTKSLRKAIIKRSNLQNIYLLKKKPESLKNYYKKKNYCSSLYRKERKMFSCNFDSSKMYNKKLRKTIQTFFLKNKKLQTKLKIYR